MRFTFVLIVIAAATAIFAGGGDWRVVVLAALAGLVIATMLEMWSLVDWLYPTADDENGPAG